MKYCVVCQDPADPQLTHMMSHHDSIEDAALAVDLWMSVGHQNLSIGRGSSLVIPDCRIPALR